MPQIPRRSADDPIESLIADLDEAGCLVVTDALAKAQREAVRSELATSLDAVTGLEHDDPESFYPGRTRRVVALIERSKSVHDAVLHPTSAALCEHHLGPNCERYQLHVSAALEVGPGARKQILHREEDPFTIFPLPRPNLVLASMWALSDFTAANGGTRLVPGSHRWEADRVPEPGEIAPAEMPAGSVLYWLGGTLHGAGANTTEAEWRCGVILTYSLGWLRQEENQFLSMSTKTAHSLSPELQALTGRAMNGALGFFDPRVEG